MDANHHPFSIPLGGATRRPLAARLKAAALACCLLGIMSLSIDLPVSSWMRSHPAGDGAVKLLTISEAFSHGAGVAMILIAAAVLDNQSRRRLPRAAAIAFGAGLMANVGKLLLARWRPRSLPGEGTVWDTFHGWLPWIESAASAGESRWGSHLQSFPSSHAATGVGLAIALTWLYPQGRWLFAALATLAALQRIDAGAHYPSDVWFGACVGCLTGAALLGENRLSRRFAEWEDRPSRREAADASRAAA